MRGWQTSNFEKATKQKGERKAEKNREKWSLVNLPFPFSHTFDKNDTNTMIKATPAMSPIRIASVFSISSSSLLVSTFTKNWKKTSEIAFMHNNELIN